MSAYTDFDPEAFRAEVVDAVRDLRLAWQKSGNQTRTPFELVAMRAIISQPQIMRSICPALRQAGDDAEQIAQVLALHLAPRINDGTLAVPLSSVVFASAALLIAELHVDEVCSALSENDGQLA